MPRLIPNPMTYLRLGGLWSYGAGTYTMGLYSATWNAHGPYSLWPGNSNNFMDANGVKYIWYTAGLQFVFQGDVGNGHDLHAWGQYLSLGNSTEVDNGRYGCRFYSPNGTDRAVFDISKCTRPEWFVHLASGLGLHLEFDTAGGNSGKYDSVSTLAVLLSAADVLATKGVNEDVITNLGVGRIGNQFALSWVNPTCNWDVMIEYLPKQPFTSQGYPYRWRQYDWVDYNQNAPGIAVMNVPTADAINYNFRLVPMTGFLLGVNAGQSGSGPVAYFPPLIPGQPQNFRHIQGFRR